MPPPLTARSVAILLLALFSVLLLQGDAHGAPVVRITQRRCDAGKCSTSAWSGTAIGRLKDGSLGVLTCAHGYDRASPASVEIAESKWVSSKFIAFDEAADLGLLAAPFPDRMEVYALAKRAPVPGSTVISIGYPGGKELRAQSTVIKGRTTGGLDISEAPFALGESGGCLLHERRLVGVIVLTDMPRFPGDRQLDGYTQNWERIAQFVNDAGGVIVETDPEPYVRGEITFGNNRKDRAAQQGQGQGQGQGQQQSVPPSPTPQDPPPGLQLGQTAPAPAPAPAPLPRPVEGAGGEKPAPAPAVDWTLAKVIVLVKDKRTGNALTDAFTGAAERIADQNGVVNLAKKAINDKTGGRADLEAVFQRVHPQRFARIVQEAGAGDGDVEVVVLVKSQFSGPLSLIEGLATSVAGKVKRSKFKDVHVEVVSQANAPSDFDSIEEVLNLADETQPETDLETLLWRVMATLAALAFGAKKVQQGRVAATAPPVQP